MRPIRVGLVALGLLGLPVFPIFGQPAPTWRLDRVYAVGAVESRVGFSYVRDALAESNGSVVVLDRTDPFLRAFSAAGTLEATWGRSGDGPGEFRQPDRLARIADAVWVYDGRQQRITVMRRDGGRARSEISRIQPPPGWAFPRPLAPLPDGGVIASVLDAASGGTGRSNRVALVVQPAGASEAAILLVVNQRSSIMQLTRNRINGEPSSGSAQQPFSSDPLWSVARDGAQYVLASRDPAPPMGAGTFRITLAETTGREIFNREYSYRPRLLNDETVTAAVRLIQSPPGWPATLRREVDASEVRAKLDRPKFLPPIDDVLLASDGRIWVRRSMLAQDPEIRYLVMSDSGDLLGEVGLPRSARVLDAHGNLVLVSDYSPVDEPILVLYRIRK